MMKWYYEWRLKRVRAEITVLQAETSVRLADDYTAHSRLRVLTRLAEGLQRRLGKDAALASGRASADTTKAGLSPALNPVMHAVVNPSPVAPAEVAPPAKEAA